MKSLVVSFAVSFALVAGAGCASHSDDVCQDIGDCAQGGSSNWIDSCEAEANALRDETAAAACGAELDAYFSCADSSYTCQGATALFPGCAVRLTDLDSCLSRATAGTACA
ncbi:MAG TPA: hypothetical protein VH560_12535, partial [Polyangia bacterium]|nr:hypothetical protein [Polyangia bacterium]